MHLSQFFGGTKPTLRSTSKGHHFTILTEHHLRRLQHQRGGGFVHRLIVNSILLEMCTQIFCSSLRLMKGLDLNPYASSETSVIVVQKSSLSYKPSQDDLRSDTCVIYLFLKSQLLLKANLHFGVKKIKKKRKVFRMHSWNRFSERDYSISEPKAPMTQKQREMKQLC